MKAVTKFDVGDSLYRSYWTTKTKHVACETCNGTGRVSIKKERFNCPKCEGKGTLKVEEKTASASGKATIQSIKVETDARGTHIFYWMSAPDCGCIEESQAYDSQEAAIEGLKANEPDGKPLYGR